jgi:hypothetical protein
MYTTFDYAARSRADDTRHAVRLAAADLSPNKTITLK